ncbi:hypothetical protein CCICO_10410 [Corynebacterium ciconiae DSM 44920]|uniref:hypothetical protein n=1 Tax=Corynebacterium ciconiae TaxID=227319 RepID=UPI00036E0FAC|nr:hypothetical protein [Corynebacterium ciconiae]WKD62081.1 hypothetical protein CCICO_10410 [Corynebacterium ciconiae DSM 44920]
MSNTGNSGEQFRRFRDPQEQASHEHTDPPTQVMRPVQQNYSPDADFAAPAGAGAAAGGYGPPSHYGPPQQPHPPQSPPPQQPQQPQEGKGNKTPVVIAGVVVLCACVLGAAVVLGQVFSGGSEQEDPSEAAATGAEEEAVETVIETITEEETPSGSSTSSSSSTSTSSRAPQPRDHFRPNGTLAGSTGTFDFYTGSSVTSEPFAAEVAKQMRSHAHATDVLTIKATSPVTHTTYTMKCVPQKSDGFTCRGGDNAVVHLVRK